MKLSIMEFVVCLTEVIDLMSETIKDHHKRVASGVYHLADAMGITGEEKKDLVLAAALHDIGALTQRARDTSVIYFEDIYNHAEKSYRLLSIFKPFYNTANYVRYHHALWDNGNVRDVDGNPIPIESQIILLVDRIAVMLNPGIDTLDQVDSIVQEISMQSGSIYSPELMEVFMETVAHKDYFWLDMMYPGFYGDIMEELKQYDFMMNEEDVADMLSLITYMIDFRCEFTARHSRGVSVVAERLAQLMGFSKDECYIMWVAGMLHDIGKLAVPAEIIEKPGKLTEQEWNIMRTHAYYTEVTISRLPNLGQVRQWAALHHESMDGCGYPYGYDGNDLSLGARVMKVADVFVAITEDRPYRKGMELEKALAVLAEEVENGKMDSNVVSILSENIDDINAVRSREELIVTEKYLEFVSNT